MSASSNNHLARLKPGLLISGLALLVSIQIGAQIDPAAAGTASVRGEPIASPSELTGATNAPQAVVVTNVIVRLPGGVSVTNFFAAPRTNPARIPPLAARKFAPAGYTPVSFTLLARFILDIPEPGSTPKTGDKQTWDTIKPQIPEEVLALDEMKIAITGFMLPTIMEKGLATEFLLMRNQNACCFGMIPRVNEFIVVKMAAHGVKPVMDQPVNVAGTLRLKPLVQDGSLLNLYEMAGGRVEVAKDL